MGPTSGRVWKDAPYPENNITCKYSDFTTYDNVTDTVSILHIIE